MKLKRVKDFFKLPKKIDKKLFKINLLFILIFLNLWDFIISRELFNGMALGFLMFGPAVLLWYVGTIRAISLLTLISIFELTVMIVFLFEGFELGGVALKSIFWIPYLVMAGVNSFYGLKVYSDHREKLVRRKA